MESLTDTEGYERENINEKRVQKNQGGGEKVISEIEGLHH